MKTTLADIAEKTGYSIATISRVLNGKSDTYRISEETATAIINEAKRSSYVNPATAQRLRKNKTKTIGIILPSITIPFFAEISDTIITEVKRRGYTAIITVTLENYLEQESCLSALLARKVEGIIAAPCGNDPRLFENINNDMVPVVFVDRFFSDSGISHITSSNYKGAVDATKLLINNGHKRIVCIQGDENSIPSKERVKGYTNAMKSAGLEEYAMVVGDSFSIQNGYLETRLLLVNDDNRPTAIFALSYTIALGVMKAIQESGLKIGDDISIISFDDNTCLDFIVPTITRVRQPVEELGKLATKVLFEHIDNSNAKSTKLELTTKIISGDSVRPINGSDTSADIVTT